MSVTVGNIKNNFPELSALPESQLQFYLNIATSLVNANVFLEKTDYAIQLLAAHFITLMSSGGGAGPVTSESVGELSRSYGTLSGNLEELSQTTYGAMLRLLIKSLPITPRVVEC